MPSINQSRDHINYQLIHFLACADISYLSVNLMKLVTIMYHLLARYLHGFKLGPVNLIKGQEGSQK